MGRLTLQNKESVLGGSEQSGSTGQLESVR